jgi:outer membrane protein OmpA-like peptidoglycan-associated protein
VNKSDRTEVEVVTHCDELQVDKSDRTEVEIVTHCDELQVDKANKTEVFYRPYSLVVHHSE